MSQLVQLAALVNAQRADVEILGVSVDTAADTATLMERLRRRGHALRRVSLLHDQQHRVIDRYGLLNYTLWAPVPHPATYLIDRAGVIRWRFVEKDFKVRASPGDVLCALQALRKFGACRQGQDQCAALPVCSVERFEPGFASPTR